MTDLNLTSWSKITSAGIWQDGKPVLHFNEDEDASSKLKSAYKELGLSYPKFFKMDGLCKIGLLASELLLDSEVKEKYADDEIALILSNNHSSLQSDADHVKQYTEGSASPAVFVYTLPNIVIGEICIRHKLLGESNFYIFEDFRSNQLLEQASLLMNATPTKACLVGWLEYYENTFEAVFFLLEKEGTYPATTQLLDTIKYTQY
ncbi:3-oxoacyl-ACP synthase [Owenweeksia hongkongensis]|uniref:3-oxoacyl-ACP synthase n=1 Tax=Owenweeksia hongkongensis TaxID=253245 RepID=UPI003A8CD4E6